LRPILARGDCREAGLGGRCILKFLMADMSSRPHAPQGSLELSNTER
jgi:hypothetical protein